LNKRKFILCVGRFFILKHIGRHR